MLHQSPFVVAAPGQTRRRFDRRPNFPIAGRLVPFGLYPLMAHPVLPGETLQSFQMKWRVISKPVNHPLAGAWLDVWLVYVKLTDIEPSLGQMFITDDHDATPYLAQADRPRTFTRAGQVDWIGLAVQAVYQAWFLDEGEPDDLTIDGVPRVKLPNNSWYQNLTFAPDAQAPATNVEALQQQLTGWQLLQQMSMTELTYEKYLQQYGVQSVRMDKGLPEVLRYARSWTTPTNTIDPATGRPSSAWTWNDDVTAEKAKRFDEPGFIVALCAVRPKLYQANLAASMVGNLWGFSDWYPIYNLADPSAGVKKITGSDLVFGPGAASAESLIYDHKDLLSHGEQFLNVPLADHPYRLPAASGLSTAGAGETRDLRGEYATPADVDALWVGTDPKDRCLFYEGMAMMRVAGHVTDTTR